MCPHVFFRAVLVKIVSTCVAHLGTDGQVELAWLVIKNTKMVLTPNE